MIVCGIDEAGRGSFIGPLVVAGVAVDDSNIRHLGEAGVRDSKSLTPAARERLYHVIRRHSVSCVVRRCLPRTIDNSVLFHGLTDLEIKKMADIIERTPADAYYVDSCYADAARFGERLERLTNVSGIHAHTKADSKFVAVSAASIVAKVVRDRAILNIRRSHPVGSGYPGDRKTARYVRDSYLATGILPDFVRKSWSTACRIVGDQRLCLCTPE